MSNNPSILAIDTSADACSVALRVGDQQTFRFTEQPRKHAELVLPMIDELLSEAGVGLKDLDGLAFGQGPGAFTGLRIAAGVVQGLAYGAGLPVIPVSSLAALGHRAHRELGWDRCHVALDARMGEVYWGSYQYSMNADAQLVGAECVCAPDKVAQAAGISPMEQYHGVGSGWIYQDRFEEQFGPLLATELMLLPHALDVLALGRLRWLSGIRVPAHEVRPVYLRNNVAAKPSAK